MSAALIGLINGLLVAYARIPAIVVTLGTASILKGGLILVTGGRWIYGLPQGFDLSHHEWFGIPVPILALVIFGVGFSLFLRYTMAGRKIYAVGGNAEAARLSGISERHVTLGVFTLNGLLVGVAAVLYATNFSSIQASVASGLELTVITAAVVGGVSILGGSGTVAGAIMGAILLQIIGTAMVFRPRPRRVVPNDPRQPDFADHSPRRIPPSKEPRLVSSLRAAEAQQPRRAAWDRSACRKSLWQACSSLWW